MSGSQLKEEFGNRIKRFGSVPCLLVLVCVSFLSLSCLQITWAEQPPWAELGSFLRGNDYRASEAKPNVVLFLVDDMGLMDCSVPFLTDEKGLPRVEPLNRFYRTPGMQRLAERGIRFNQFYANSVCSPTRLSILTGQYSARHRTTNWIQPDQNNRTPQGPPNWNWQGLKPNQTSLQGLLKAARYRTIYVGKSHLAPTQEAGSNPSRLGFDINVGGSSIGHPGSYSAEKNYGAGGTHAVPHLDEFHGTDVHLSEALTRKAKEQISLAVDAKQPFYLQLSHYAVHAPFESDPRYASNYKDSGKPPQAQAFATLVEGMDDSLNQLLDHLEKLDIAENTLVIFLGDNGSDAPLGHHHEIACAAPLRGRKGTQYEGGIRTPLIASWASPNPENPLQRRVPIRSGFVHDQMASVCDLMPTILDVAEVKMPADHVVDGSSIRSLLSGERNPNRREEFLMHFPHEHRDRYFTVFRQGDWKLIYHYFPLDQPEEKQYQLFNLQADPTESNNLSEAEPKKLTQMMETMVERLKETGALYPVTNLGKAIDPMTPYASNEPEVRRSR
jgi:arylsulfatase A-like enzyme